MAAAEENEYEVPAAWTCAAVAWSCGSLGPPNAPPVPPGDDLTPKAVGGAVSMTAIQNTAQIEKRAGALLEIGMEFAARPIPEDDETFKAEPAKAAPPSPTPQANPLPTPTPTAPPAPKPAPAPVISPPPSQFTPAPARPPRRPPPPDEGGGWVTKPL